MVVITSPDIYKNGTYHVVIVTEPEGKYRCYGVENRQTGIVEAYISQLARAMQVADQFEQDLKIGFRTSQDEGIFEDASIAALSGSKKKGSGGNRAN